MQARWMPDSSQTTRMRAAWASGRCTLPASRDPVGWLSRSRRVWSSGSRMRETRSVLMPSTASPPRGFTPARPLHLFSMYVRAVWHGTGVGQALLDAVVGDEPAQLWVLEGNARAIPFYRRNGFSFDGVEYSDPLDANLIELRLVR